MSWPIDFHPAQNFMHRNSRFTNLDIIITIAVIGLLFSFAVPAVISAVTSIQPSCLLSLQKPTPQ